MTDSDRRADAAAIPPPFIGGSATLKPVPSPQQPAGPYVPGARPVPSRSPEPPATPPPSPASHPPASEPPAPPEPMWEGGEWQRYDWQGAAGLQASSADAARAAHAWTDLDWDAEARQRASSRAESVAAALEVLARRIRSGDLIVRGHPGMTPEAAIAATLAALLETRR